MASTVIEMRISETVAPTKVRLERIDNSQVAASASGYTLTLDPAQPWTYRFTVTEALVGFYIVHIFDADGNTLDVGATEIPADVAGPFTVSGDLLTAQAAANARKARQMVTNKQTWVEQGDGTYNITVRSDDDTYDEFVINGFNRRDGSRDNPTL